MLGTQVGCSPSQPPSDRNRSEQAEDGVDKADARDGQESAGHADECT